MFASDLRAVFHVRNDHQRAHRGNQIIMLVYASRLILNEILRFSEFTYIMKICADTTE